MRDLPAAVQPAGKLHLSARHRATIEALLRKHLPDVEVWAYGSRVNGQSHDGSDLDLVLRGPGLAKIDVSRLADFMEAVGSSTIPFLVEAHDWASLPERFHRQIERDHVVFVEKDRSRQVVWPEKRIEEIAEKIAMGPFGSSIRVNTFVPEGIPIISGQHLHGVRVDDSPGFNFITEEHAERLKNANVQRGDIVFSHRGTVGQVAYVPDDSTYDRYVVSQSQFYLRCDRRQVIPQFIAYYFKTHEGRHRLLANTSQVGVPSIAQPVSYLRSISIPLPPLEEQRAIVHVLEKIEDKIELNRRMNRTLGAMARALFKSWFVDFDPVRAKIEGRDTGLPAYVADLFPDRLLDSDLGMKPEGWEVTELGDCVDVVRGLSYKGSGLSVDGLPLHNLNSIYEGGGYKEAGIKFYDGDFRPRHGIRPGEVIVANTEQGHDRLLIGHAAIVPSYFGHDGLFSHHLYKLELNQVRGLGPDYLCELLNSPIMHDMVSGYATGTTVNMLPIDALKHPLVVVPPAPLIDVFGTLAAKIRERRDGYLRESRVLAGARDELLPRLVSGNI